MVKTFLILSCLISFTFQNICSQTLMTTNYFSKDKIGQVVKQNVFSSSEDTLQVVKNQKPNIELKKCSFDHCRVLLFSVFGFALGGTVGAYFSRGTFFTGAVFALRGAVIGFATGFVSASIKEDRCREQRKKDKSNPTHNKKK